MVLLLALLVSTFAGLTAFLLIARWPHADPALDVSEAVEEELRVRSGSPGSFVRDRMDPAKATGLALTVALIGLVVAGIIVGLLAWTIRRDAGLVDVDHAVEIWADERATPLSDDVLDAITHLADTTTILVVGIAISVYGVWRFRRPAIPILVASVVVGQILISNTIKTAIDRAPAGAPSARRLQWDVVPQRSHDGRGRHLSGRSSRARHRQLSEGPSGARGRGGRDRRRRRLHPGPARRPLVLRRAGRARDRMVVVRHLRGGVRRSAVAIRGTRRHRAHRDRSSRSDLDRAAGSPRAGREVHYERDRSKARVLPTRRRGRETPPRSAGALALSAGGGRGCVGILARQLQGSPVRTSTPPRGSRRGHPARPGPSRRASGAARRSGGSACSEARTP